ncbi:MAG: helix-turn-helix domain-containing protein [Pseudonocardiales bacterium]|nr:helix-turn-helix domain-containing protein [Pseudonocardiales bacterium]
MSTDTPSSGSPVAFSIRETAWILGVSKSEVSRLIRVGVLPTVRRRSRLVVPAYVLARLLRGPDEGQAR